MTERIDIRSQVKEDVKNGMVRGSLPCWRGWFRGDESIGPVIVYVMGKTSLCAGKRAAALLLPEPEMPADVALVMLNERGYFIKNIKKRWRWRAFDPRW